MTNEIIEFYREHLKPIIQKMLLKTNYQGQGKVDYEEFGRDFDELLDLAIIGMQSNSDEDCISRAAALKNLALTNSKDDVYRMINSLSSVQPKPKADVLDNIRAEIQGLRNCSCSCSDGIIDDVEDIIDKYKAESEDKE